MLKIPRMILVGSANRNHGKTTLACAVIKKFETKVPIVALKVIGIDDLSGKCQRGESGCGLCALSEGRFELIQECNRNIEKDTSLMLQAGAKESYLLKSLKTSMIEAMDEFLKKIPDDYLIVCESNTLRRFVIPGIFLFAKRADEQIIKPSAKKVMKEATCVMDPYNNMDLSPIRLNRTSCGLSVDWYEDGEKGAVTCL